MARRATGHRQLRRIGIGGMLAIGLSTATQMATAVNQATAAPPKSTKQTNDAKTKTDSKSPPSAQLLEYLGQYEDAADGVDPLEFQDDTIKTTKPAYAGDQESNESDKSKLGSGSGP